MPNAQDVQNAVRAEFTQYGTPDFSGDENDGARNDSVFHSSRCPVTLTADNNLSLLQDDAFLFRALQFSFETRNLSSQAHQSATSWPVANHLDQGKLPAGQSTTHWLS